MYRYLVACDRACIRGCSVKVWRALNGCGFTLVVILDKQKAPSDNHAHLDIDSLDNNN